MQRNKSSKNLRSIPKPPLHTIQGMLFSCYYGYNNQVGWADGPETGSNTASREM